MKAGDYIKTGAGSVAILISRKHNTDNAWNCILVYSKNLSDMATPRNSVVFEDDVILVKPIFIKA
jgi:hypothetical protein